eukprot:2817747-Amphidinium_carterae.1
MKAHQSDKDADKDADEGRVERVDLQGNRMADVAVNNGTREHLPLEPSEAWNNGAMFVRLCVTSGSWWVRNCELVLNSGPGSRVRPLLPSLKQLTWLCQLRFRLHCLPLATSTMLHVVEHEAYATCLDCQRHVGVHTGRKCFNCHKGRPCTFLKRKKGEIVSRVPGRQGCVLCA